MLLLEKANVMLPTGNKNRVFHALFDLYFLVLICLIPVRFVCCKDSRKDVLMGREGCAGVLSFSPPLICRPVLQGSAVCSMPLCPSWIRFLPAGAIP